MTAPADPLADLPPAEEPPSVGTAEMADDGTLRLMLRTETDDGLVGEMVLTLAPDHARYAEYVAHLGGMAPGDVKAIPPFPAPVVDPKSV